MKVVRRGRGYRTSLIMCMMGNGVVCVVVSGGGG